MCNKKSKSYRKRSYLPSPRRQSGAVLFFGLIILLVMTWIGTSGITSVTLEERMTSNMQNANKAFQGAEAILAECEETVSNAAEADLIIGGVLDVREYGTTAKDHGDDWWADETFWQANGTESATTELVQSGSNPDGLAFAPRCIIEHVGKYTAKDLMEQALGDAPVNLYRVVGFSYGADTSASSVVESLFVRYKQLPSSSSTSVSSN